MACSPTSFLVGVLSSSHISTCKIKSMICKDLFYFCLSRQQKEIETLFSHNALFPFFSMGQKACQESVLFDLALSQFSQAWEKLR